MVACRRKPFVWTCLLEDIFEVFLVKFFPDTAKAEMEQKFINLKQAGRTVDEYAAEFFKLS